MNNCYLCGCSPATKPLLLKDSFTAHSLAKCPHSQYLCYRCDWSINLRANYFNPNKNKYSVLYSRNWSWLYKGTKLIAPNFNGEKDGLPIVENLPTRELLREWLVNPPEPPFTIAIAESGQKHILFLAQEALSREMFPVLFELDLIYINHYQFTDLLNTFEKLMQFDCTKTEILTGQYKSTSLHKNLWDILNRDNLIAPYRGSRLLDLIAYVAIKTPLDLANIQTETTNPVQVKIEESTVEQLSLF